MESAKRNAHNKEIFLKSALIPIALLMPLFLQAGNYNWIDYSSFNDSGVIYQTDSGRSGDSIRQIDAKNKNTYFCLDGSLVFRKDTDKFTYFSPEASIGRFATPIELEARVKTFTVLNRKTHIPSGGTNTNWFRNLSGSNFVPAVDTLTNESHAFEFLTGSNESVLVDKSEVIVKDISREGDPKISVSQTQSRCLNFDLYMALNNEFISEFTDHSIEGKNINLTNSGGIENIDQVARLQKPINFYNLNKKAIVAVNANQVVNNLSYIKFIHGHTNYLLKDHNLNYPIKTFRLSSGFEKYESYQNNETILESLVGMKCFKSINPAKILFTISALKNGSAVEVPTTFQFLTPKVSIENEPGTRKLLRNDRVGNYSGYYHNLGEGIFLHEYIKDVQFLCTK